MSATALAESAPAQYTTQGVAQATGIPVTTILAWERRYGLPRPRRAEGGRRLYTERDVELLRAMRCRTAEGVRAELAARELRQAADGRVQIVRRPALTYLPTQVEELHCLHCGHTCGELLTQHTDQGRAVRRFVLLPGGVRPTRNASGRLRCGRCSGDLFREPLERRTLPPFPPAPRPDVPAVAGAA
jgi:DNA-binding transcriptional MerR regulator